MVKHISIGCSVGSLPSFKSVMENVLARVVKSTTLPSCHLIFAFLICKLLNVFYK
jgi:hypothetical protein